MSLSISEKRELEFYSLTQTLIEKIMDGYLDDATDIAKQMRIMTIDDLMQQNVGTKKKKELMQEREVLHGKTNI